MAGAVRWIGDGEVEKGNNGRKVWWLEAWPKVWWLREVGWLQVVWSEGVVAGLRRGRERRLEAVWPKVWEGMAEPRTLRRSDTDRKRRKKKMKVCWSSTVCSSMRVQGVFIEAKG